MINMLFRRKAHLRHHLDAPLLAERCRYLRLLHDRGVTPNVLRGNADMLLRVSEFLHLRDGDASVIGAEAIHSAAVKWSRASIPRRPAGHNADLARRDFTSTAVSWIAHMGRLDARLSSDGIFGSLIKCPTRRLPYVIAPLYAERLKYLLHWQERGASRATLRKISEHQLHAVLHIPLDSTRMVTHAEIERAARKWMSSTLDGSQRRAQSESSRKLFVSHATRWLRFVGRLDSKSSARPHDDIIADYVLWMRTTRGLSPGTIESLECNARDFLFHLDRNHLSLEGIGPSCCDSFLAECGKRMSRRTMAGTVTRLRNFLVFAESRGLCPQSCRLSLFAPKIHSDESVPSFVPWERVLEMLRKSSASETPVGIRNHAILMLFSAYGLRTCELTALTLDDFDWRDETIRVRRAKGGRSQSLPLAAPVGEAVIRYIRNGRPTGFETRNLFLTALAPFGPLKPTAAYHVVHNALLGEHVAPSHSGPHCLRHSFATHLINSGHTLKEVADLLGHRSVESTRIYAKVDLAALRDVAETSLEDML